MKNKGIDIIEEYKVVITWRNDIPLIKQITSLRKVCPELSNMISSDFLKLARSSEKFVLGYFTHWRVGEIIRLGQQLGLRISAEG